MSLLGALTAAGPVAAGVAVGGLAGVGGKGVGDGGVVVGDDAGVGVSPTPPLTMLPL